MKAVLCKVLGPPDKLVIEQVPSLRPGKGQVLVSVKAAGVNFPDTLIIQGKYQFKPEPPFSPGVSLQYMQWYAKSARGWPSVESSQSSTARMRGSVRWKITLSSR